MTKKTISILSAALIACALPLAQAAIRMPASITVADLATETAARKTLEQARVSAAVVADDAGQLRLIANSKASSDSHLAQLTAVKADINRMGQEIGSLEAERESLVPWEQQAIDKVLPLLQATAANTESAIEYFRDNRDRLWTETYRDYTARIGQDSEQMAKTLKNCLKEEKLGDREVRLEERIEASSD